MLQRELDRVGKLDGLLVAPHGAGVCESEPDMDGDWLSAVRERVGPDRPDRLHARPHANVSQRMIDACDATIAYRTNPHLDQRARGLEAGDPARANARRRDPSDPGGGISRRWRSTSRRRRHPPRRAIALIVAANAERARPGILSNSVLLGFPYADVAEWAAVSSPSPTTTRRWPSDRPTRWRIGSSRTATITSATSKRR
jgi:microcystin degradation protein MlrC